MLVSTSPSTVRYFSNFYISIPHKVSRVPAYSYFVGKGVRSRADHQLLEQVWLAAMATGPNSLHDAGSCFTCLGYTQVAIADTTVAPMYVVNFLLSLS